jgi:hypothetical protein
MNSPNFLEIAGRLVPSGRRDPLFLGRAHVFIYIPAVETQLAGTRPGHGKSGWAKELSRQFLVAAQPELFLRLKFRHLQQMA